MKKSRIGLILLLCALLLCSCTQKPAPTPEPTPAPSLSAAHGVQTPAPTAAPEATPAPTEAPLETVALDDGTPRFSEMVYERPDLSELDRLIEAAEAAMNGGSSYAETEPLLDEVFAFYDHYDTMYTLADIRSCLDQTDEYYADEYLWCSENYTLADEAIDGLYYACAASPLGQELEPIRWKGMDLLLHQDSRTRGFRKGTSLLLPPYDEYLIGYKSRIIVLPEVHAHRAHNTTGNFYPVVLSDGVVSGSWKPFEDNLEVEMFDGTAPFPSLASNWQVYKRFRR